MGGKVLYCRKCGAAIASERFKRGEAILLQGRPLCLGCVGGPVPAAPEAPSQRPSQRMPIRPHGAVPQAGRGRKGRLPLLAGAAASVAGIAAVAWFFLGRPEPSPVPEAPTARRLPGPKTAEKASREPVSPPPTAPVPGAPPPAGLTTEMERELEALEAAKEEACGAEEFSKAVAILEEALNRRTDVPWVRAVEAKILQVRIAAAQLLGPIKEKACEARRRGAVEEVRSLVERVSRWGLGDLSTELDRALEEVVAPPPRDSAPGRAPEAQLYAGRWEEAMALAADRDYAAAIRALEEASQKLEDRKLQGEAAADMELLRQVREVVREADRRFSTWPRGEKISLEIFEPTGDRKGVVGVAARTGPGWVEVQGEKETRWVDFGDLTGSSVAALIRSRPQRKESDDRLATILLLLEGDSGGTIGEDVPGALREHAKRRAAWRPPSNPLELEARSVFLSILDPQRGWPEDRRRGGTAERCRALLEKYGATAFVRRHRAAIDRLAEPAREYLFGADDLRGAGTFRPTVHPRLGKVWTVSESVAGASARENYVELEFEALPETSYRGWACVGGCCSETFQFYWQATELRGPLQKGGPPLEVEPGANAALPLRHSVGGLPATHASHPAGPAGLKWTWIPLPLPKYGAPGSKRVRLLAEAMGASVAGVLISAVRSAAPADSELAELNRVESAPEPESGAGKKPLAGGLREGLVARWSFDEGAGTSSAAADGRGFAGGLRNGASWGPGRVGTALVFDGVDDFFEVPDAPGLDPAQITLTAWVFPEELRSSGNTRDWIVSKGRNEWTDGHYGLAIDTRERQPIAYLNTGGGRAGAVEVRGPARLVVAGTWCHMAMTWDGAVLKLYFNGVLVGARPVNRPRPPAQGSLVVGKRGDDWSKFKGRIDEVRLYERALSAAEVQAVFRSAGATRPN